MVRSKPKSFRVRHGGFAVAKVVLPLVILLLTGSPCDTQADTPDPRTTILIGVWGYPPAPDNPLDARPTFDQSGTPDWFVANFRGLRTNYYSYDSIRAAGIDVIMTPFGADLQKPGHCRVSARAANDAGLYYVPLHPDIYGQRENSSHSARRVRRALTDPAWASDTDTSVIGWYIWDEPQNDREVAKAIRLNSMVREEMQASGLDRRKGWFTFLGWFVWNDSARVTTMLRNLATSPSGAAQVVGHEAFRFMNPNEVENPHIYPMDWLNASLASFFRAVRDHAPGTPWWSVTHVTDEFGMGGPCVWYPDGVIDEASLRMDVFTRLAWGAKGITYLTYSHYIDRITMQAYRDCRPLGTRRVYDGRYWGADWVGRRDGQRYARFPGVFEPEWSRETQSYRPRGFNAVYRYMEAVNKDISRLKRYLGPAEVYHPVISEPPSVGGPYPKSSAFVDAVSALEPDSVLRPFKHGWGGPDKAAVLVTPMKNGSDWYLLIVNQNIRYNRGTVHQSVRTGEAGDSAFVQVRINTARLNGPGTYTVRNLVDGRTKMSVRTAGGVFTLFDTLDTGEFRMYQISR